MPINDPNSPIENLTFEGGGAKGAAYAGAVDVLDEHGLYAGVRRIAGTSAGAMTAALLATGGGSAGLQQVIETTDFHVFTSDGWGLAGDVVRMWRNYGLHTADGFVEVMRDAIDRYSGSADLTFAELSTLALQRPDTFKDLSVIASNVARRQRHVFDAATAPDLPVWKAVRASMSIPLLFEPVVIDGDHYVDGGLAWNNPIDLYDAITRAPGGGVTRTRNPATLGFFLESQAEIEAGGAHPFRGERTTIDSARSFGGALADFLYSAANSRELAPADRDRTVFIDDLGVGTTDFGLHGERLLALVDSGRRATEAFLVPV